MKKKCPQMKIKRENSPPSTLVVGAGERLLSLCPAYSEIRNVPTWITSPWLVKTGHRDALLTVVLF